MSEQPKQTGDSAPLQAVPCPEPHGVIRHRRTGDLDTTVSRLKAENEHLRWQVEQALDQLLSGKHYDAEATLEAALAGSSGAPSA